MLYTKENGKLVETIEQPVVEIHYSLEEVEQMLVESEKRRDIKAMELAGAEQEVMRIKALKDKCVELGVEAKVAEVAIDSLEATK